MPTLRGLECLLAVVDCGSVTDAAARLHASQPAVSHQLAALERELGVTLLERLPRGVRPTVAGRAVLPHARAAVDSAAGVVRTARAIASGRGGLLRIACAPSLTGPVLAPVLRGWRDDHPGVEITITEEASADQLAQLVAEGAADLAVCPRPTVFAGQTLVLGRESVVAVVGPDHRWADRTRVRRSDLHGEPAVHYRPENGLGGWIDTVLAQDGVVLDVVVRTQQATAAAELAAAGVGVAVVPAGAVPAGFAGSVVDLQPALRRDIVALSMGSADPVIRGFLATARRCGVPGALAGDPPIG